MNKPFVKIEDLGTVDYKEAWEYQTLCHAQLVDQKRSDPRDVKVPSRLIICEHPPVYTLGKSGKEEHLVWNQEERQKRGVDYYKINRGGDITYHGPGQLVVYPIFDLDRFFRDVHRYVRSLEEVIIRTLRLYGLEGQRLQGYTGVWVHDDRGYRKICAIGVHLSRWVSMHGLAFNVNPVLSHFEGIVPCGIQEEGKSVTSISKELGRPISIEEVKKEVLNHFQQVFEYDIYE